MRKIESPIKRWAGWIELPDYLTLPQIIAWNDAFETARQFTTERKRDETTGKIVRAVTDAPNYYHAMLRGVCPIVVKWELNGGVQFTAETFPATPIKSAQALARWVVDAVADLIMAEDEDPKD